MNVKADSLFRSNLHIRRTFANHDCSLWDPEQSTHINCAQTPAPQKMFSRLQVIFSMKSFATGFLYCGITFSDL